MSDLVLSPNDILQAVRTSKCATAKKRKPAKVRVGVYGPTLPSAITRLAKKLEASYTMVSSLVNKLLNQGVLQFVGKRLMPTRSARNTKMISRTAIVTAITFDLNDSTTFAPSNSAEKFDNPELARWLDVYGDQLDVPPGDLFRQAAWGSGFVPALDDWQKRSRDAVMADHPSNTTQHLSVA